MFGRQKWKNLIAEAEQEVTSKGGRDDGAAVAAATVSSSLTNTLLSLTFPLPASFAFQGSYTAPAENATFSCTGKLHLKKGTHDNSNTNNSNTNNNDNQKMISISGGGTNEDGTFQITQGKVSLVTGKCFWVEQMEQQPTSGGSGVCCCCAEARQTIVIGVFYQDIPSGELCAFQGSWYANNGTSGTYPAGLTLSRYTSVMNLREPPLAIATATPTPTPVVNNRVPPCPLAPAVPIEETLSSVPSIFRPPDQQVQAVISIPERAASSSSRSFEQPTSVVLTQDDVVMLDPDPMMGTTTTINADTSHYFSTTGSNYFQDTSSTLFHSSMMQPPIHTTMMQEEQPTSSLQQQSPQPADGFRLPSIFRPPSFDQ